MLWRLFLIGWVIAGGFQYWQHQTALQAMMTPQERAQVKTTGFVNLKSPVPSLQDKVVIITPVPYQAVYILKPNYSCPYVKDLPGLRRNIIQVRTFIQELEARKVPYEIVPSVPITSSEDGMILETLINQGTLYTVLINNKGKANPTLLEVLKEFTET